MPENTLVTKDGRTIPQSGGTPKPKGKIDWGKLLETGKDLKGTFDDLMGLINGNVVKPPVPTTETLNQTGGGNNFSPTPPKSNEIVGDQVDYKGFDWKWLSPQTWFVTGAPEKLKVSVWVVWAVRIAFVVLGIYLVKTLIGSKAKTW